MTHYRTLKRNGNLALLAIHLDTGRTHQIRVHMKYIGHPLIGDDMYAAEYMYMNRQALHSYKLKFTHPVTGKEMEFTAELPDDMRSVLNEKNGV